MRARQALPTIMPIAKMVAPPRATYNKARGQGVRMKVCWIHVIAMSSTVTTTTTTAVAVQKSGIR